MPKKLERKLKGIASQYAKPGKLRKKTSERLDAVKTSFVKGMMRKSGRYA